MPIPIRELEEARRTPEERILRFLGAPAQRGAAFSQWEILRAVDGPQQANAVMIVLAYTMAAGKPAPNVPTLQALFNLVRDGKVTKQSMNDEDYYYLAAEAPR